MSASSAAWWLLPVLIALSAAAKLPREDFNQNQEFDLEMETGLVLHGSSPRGKRSADIDDIRNANNKVMTYRKLRKDEELELQEQFNAIEKILPAPLAINLLSQIVLIAAVGPDFHVICPRGEGGCKYLKYPDSFKSSLLQLSYGAYDAFNAAHVNMDIIDRNMKSLPGEVRFALITLLQGSDEDIELLLPDQLAVLKRIAIKSIDSATATVEAFDDVKEILEELIVGGTATKKKTEHNVTVTSTKIWDAKLRKENFERQKKEAEEKKEKIRKLLEKAEMRYEESLDDFPDGWELLGMDFLEGTKDALFNILGAFTPSNIIQLAKEAAGLNPISLGVDGVSKIISTICKDDKDDKAKNQQNNTQPLTSIGFPSCNLVPARGGRVIITEEVRAGYDFLTAVTNMKITIEHLEAYIDVIFDRPTKDQLSLVPDAAQRTNTTRSLLKPHKDQIDRTAPNSVPMGMKGTAVTFYRQFFSFMDKVSNMSTNRDSNQPDDYRNLEKEALDLSRSGQCFQTWVNRLLNLPSVTPKLPFHEKQEGGRSQSASQRAYEQAKWKVEEMKEKLEKQEKNFEDASSRLLNVNNDLLEQIIDLEQFDATKATLDSVLAILKKSLAKLSELKEHWLQIREFFQIIKNMVDEDVATHIENFTNLLGNGKKSASLRRKNYYKNGLYKYIQDINTNGYLVRKLSTTYLNVSDTYILPPVRELGKMLSADNDESMRLRAKIAAETRTASKEMNLILQDQQREFLDSLRKRRDELIAVYQPIMEHIPEERQRAIEKEVKEISAKIPDILRKEAGVEDSVDFFLDV